MTAWMNFHDAVHEAHFRAALTRRRYRVAYDQANQIWSLFEMIQRVPDRTA